MTIHEQKQEGYITLKEASERFGYAPDYIGQLIRKGKIEGKQVYANVAWMTTEEAMEAYKAEAGEKRAAKTEPHSSQFSVSEFVAELSSKLFSPLALSVLTLLLRFVCVLLVLVLLVTFYLLSVAFDHTMSERAEERLEMEVKSGKVPVVPPLSYKSNAPLRI